MRDHADVPRKQLRTRNYSAEARATLGKAVENARVAAGYKFRTDFCRAYGIKNLRGLELLEQGEPGVGQAFLYEIADALPHWTRETPQLILEEGLIPPTGSDVPDPVDEPVAVVTPASMRLVEEIRSDLAKRGITMTPKMAVAFLQGVDQQLGAELRQVETETTERDRSP